MNEIICNKCNATFTPDMIEIQKKVITQDEHGDDVIEQYYECPICGAHYTITIMDRVQRIAVQKRRQYQQQSRTQSGQESQQERRPTKTRKAELADDIQARAKMLKEKYREYTEE